MQRLTDLEKITTEEGGEMVEIRRQVGLRDCGKEYHEERNCLTKIDCKVGEVSVDIDIAQVTTVHVDTLLRT